MRNHFRLFHEPQLSELARTRQGIRSERKDRLLLVDAPVIAVKSHRNNFAEVPIFQQRVIAKDTIAAQVGPRLCAETNHRL